jgi:hypothetical protein
MKSDTDEHEDLALVHPDAMCNGFRGLLLLKVMFGTSFGSSSRGYQRAGFELYTLDESPVPP